MAMAVTNYLWDDDNIVLETDEADATLAQYTYEPEVYGNLISERRGGQTYQHHYDALGSTRILTDENGQITDTFEYDAWGNEVARTGAIETPFRWLGKTGYSSSAASGVWVRRRLYNKELGRWSAVDPLGLTDALNVYLYSRNEPVSVSDPSGLKCGPANRIGTKYGCFCGVNRKAQCVKRKKCTKCNCYIPRPSPPNPVPIDRLDIACLDHDCCLASEQSWWTIFICYSVCNKAFCAKVDAIDCKVLYPRDGRKEADCNNAKDRIDKVFCVAFHPPKTPKALPKTPKTL
jgi:RHS repeat-associated protein